MRKADGAVLHRWLDPLGNVPRRPDRGGGTLRGDELMLRADYVPGARRRAPARLTGVRAAAAPAGRELGTHPVELRRGLVVRASLVELPDRIVLDAFRGSRRVARIEVPGAEPGGALMLIEQEAEAPSGSVHVSWWNPESEAPLNHRYRLGPRSIAFVD
jgi:hypothetical protein